ncbi:MAG: P-loop NTPase [Deltaproteobacteria bacterium]|nr:P-loop NTPase [Deltaproteobacteria bacterium]
MSGEDNSSLKREPVKATFVFDGQPYEVTAISADGLQVECPVGFAPETIRQLREGGFEFVLRDPITRNEIELAGELVRTEQAGEDGRVVKIWIVKNEKEWSRPGRPGGERTGREQEDGIALAVPRGRAVKTIAVGGGKGGVGKTLITVNLALSLSRQQKNVTLLDGDFGNGNCNTLLGITRIENSLEEYLRQERSLEEVIVSTAYPGLRLVCGAQNKVDAWLTSEKSRLLEDIRQIEADCLLFDLGAGMNDETLELYRIADHKIVVVTPQMTSLQNAYGFVKSAFYYDLKTHSRLAALLDQAGNDTIKLHDLIGRLKDGHPARQAFEVVRARQGIQIVGNQVNDDRDLKIVKNLQKVVEHYLHIDNRILGILPSSDAIRSSINRITPFAALFPDSPVTREIDRMARELTRGMARSRF